MGRKRWILQQINKIMVKKKNNIEIYSGYNGAIAKTPEQTKNI